MDHLCFAFLVLFCLFIAALWSPAGKGLTSWVLLVMFIVFLLLSYVVSWSGVVLDCIVSRSLPHFLLCWNLEILNEGCVAFTVNSEIFARVLFSRNFASFVKIKSSRNAKIILLFTNIPFFNSWPSRYF